MQPYHPSSRLVFSPPSRIWVIRPTITTKAEDPQRLLRSRLLAYTDLQPFQPHLMNTGFGVELGKLGLQSVTE